MLYFALVGPKRSNSEIGAVAIPQLERDYYALSRDDGIGVNTFEFEHNQLMERVRDLITQLLSQPDSANCLRQLTSRLGLRIVTVEYDDIETEQELILT